MLIWIVALVGMIPLVVETQRLAFPTLADREAYARIANTPALAALTGLPYAANTLGGILNIKLWMTIAVALSLAVIFQVTRNGRAEEESGRAEMLRSGVLGQHAYALANWVMAAGFAGVVGLASALAAMSTGLPAEGAFVMGASFTGVAFVFIGVAALAGQIAQSARGANGIAASILGIAYLVRAAGDLRGTGDTPDAISWLSPIGWGQQMRSYGENRWWPMLLLVGGTVVLCAIALRIEGRRDVGAGLLPDRHGPREASRFIRTPVGLTLRLQRGSLIGWTVGILIGALFYGAVATAAADLFSGDNPLASAMFGSSATVLDGMLAYFVLVDVMFVAAFTLQSADAMRAEEANGSTEVQWSAAISRFRWAASRLVVPAVASLVLLGVSGFALGVSFGASVSDPSQGWRYAGAALTYWPSMLVLIALVVVLAAWLPRWASLITWSVYAVSVVVSTFGDIFGLPDWVIDNTVFSAVPRVPSEAFAVAPLVALTLVAILVGSAGLWRLRGRDMVGE